MKRVLSKNLLAQTYSQSVIFAVQLGSVPLLIQAWGIETFGVWILLTAIPTYLSFSDFGFTFVAKNDMSMRVAGGDRVGALETFQSIFVLLLLVAAVLIVVLGGAVLLLPWSEIFNLGAQTSDTARDVLLLQIVSALLYQFMLLLSAGVRCEGRAALETSFAASARLLDAGAILTTALLGGDLVDVAIAALIMRLFSLSALGVWLRVSTPWLILGTSKASISRIKEKMLPSLTYMMVPISNALLIQAPVIILGGVASPAIVALYAITRTVSRLGMSVANMLNYSFVPEYSFAQGRGDFPRFKSLLRLHLILTGAGVITYMAVAPFVVPFGVALLSKGLVVPNFYLGLILVVAISLEMVWSGLFSPSSALNAHRPVAVAFLVVSCGAIGLGSLMPSLYMLASSIGVAHGLVLIVSFLTLIRLYKDLRGSQKLNHEEGEAAYATSG